MATGPDSLHEIVERRMLRVHLRPAHGVHDDIRRLRRAGGVARRRHQPVVVVRRHQHQLAPAMAGDLDRLTLGLVLELAELALELHCCGSSHNILNTEASDHQYSPYNPRNVKPDVSWSAMSLMSWLVRSEEHTSELQSLMRI